MMSMATMTAFAADNYTITNGTPESDKETNHGYITVNETAAKGKTVKITVVPDEGYQLKSLTVAPTASPEYVEIGGLKWATKNLGAEKETDFGDYFAWGETAPYYDGTGGWPATPTWKSGKASGYAWQSYCGSSSFSEWSTPPYDTTTKILKPEFDAAAQILGGGWRMPTSAEFKALYDACLNGSYDTTTNPSGASASVGKGVYWCTNYDGVAGCLFCDGTNKLFFPAAGEGKGTNLSNAAFRGYYWSSSRSGMPSSYAYYLIFGSDTVADPQYDYERCLGFSVRPVKDVAPANKLAPVDPETITPEKQDDGTYQFTMPDYNVTVTAEFEATPEPDPINYKIIEGANSVWTVSAGESPTFRSNADFSKFSHVLLDGKELAKKYYKAESGSTIVTLKPEYAATLSVGKHTIEIVSTDGSASTVFYIEETIANTDGEGFALSTAAMSSALIGCNIVGLAVVFFELKKKKKVR